MAKRKTLEDVLNNDETLQSLLAKYWRMIKKENIGKTTQLTPLIDKVEESVKKRKLEIIEEYERTKSIRKKNKKD